MTPHQRAVLFPAQPRGGGFPLRGKESAIAAPHDKEQPFFANPKLRGETLAQSNVAHRATAMHHVYDGRQTALEAFIHPQRGAGVNLSVCGVPKRLGPKNGSVKHRVGSADLFVERQRQHRDRRPAETGESLCGKVNSRQPLEEYQCSITF